MSFRVSELSLHQRLYYVFYVLSALASGKKLEASYLDRRRATPSPYTPFGADLVTLTTSVTVCPLRNPANSFDVWGRNSQYTLFRPLPLRTTSGSPNLE